MKWVVRRKSDNKYFCSRYMLVYMPQFARKFNDRRMANRLVKNLPYDPKELAVEKLEETGTELIGGHI